MTWFKLERFTKMVMRTAQACTVPSQQEKINLSMLAPNHVVEIIPHCVDLSYYEGSFGPPKKNWLVFTGSFTHQANMDAVLYFLEEIFPKIKAKLPEVCFQVVGSTNGVDVSSWPVDHSVLFSGLQKDIRQIVAQSWLSVVPLRIGAGTRLKIIESMALGTPVVSTSKGAEGLEVTHKENILIADNPIDFSDAVIELLQDDQLRERLSVGGLRLVRDSYSSEAMGRKFGSLLDQIGTN
jgi:glycosyltransferase involved in cell wall biosynthesis